MSSKKVGVIGGGQLAWMMAEAAPKLGLELPIQTPSPDDPAVGRVKQVIYAPVADASATAKLANLCDVITFENEFIDLTALKKLANQGVCFRPSLDALSPLLDKYEQRSFLKQIGLPVPEFTALNPDEKIPSNYKFPFVLKARRHGYDGQGTWIVQHERELATVLAKVPPEEILLEEFVPFEKELGIIVARNVSGEVAIYPVTETRQKDRVCHWAIAPAAISAEIAARAREIARTLVEKLQVVGVFGIEFFLIEDGKILVNEIAPRTHNSGHYTLDGCETSQFEMQLRAVTDMSLGSTAFKEDGALMVNLLGYEDGENTYQDKRDRLQAIPRAFLQWYGKASRKGRKLGHVTVLLKQAEFSQAKSIINDIETIWYGKS